MKTAIIAGSSVLALAAFAHGGMDHIMGVVKSFDGKTLTVETKEKKEISVAVDSTTEVEKAGSKGAVSDIVVGSRVAIHAMKMKDVLTAHEVKIGAPTDAGFPLH